MTAVGALTLIGQMLLLVAACVVAAISRTRIRSAFRAFAALPTLKLADPDRDMLIARMAMTRVDQLASLKGLSGAERIRTANPFLALAIWKLGQVEDAAAFEQWADEMLGGRQERHAEVHRFWYATANAAPSLGIAGALLAVAATALYGDFPGVAGPVGTLVIAALPHLLAGVAIAQYVALPVATRLEELSRQEHRWQQELVRRMAAVARREIAPLRRAAIRRVA